MRAALLLPTLLVIACSTDADDGAPGASGSGASTSGGSGASAGASADGGRSTGGGAGKGGANAGRGGGGDAGASAGKGGSAGATGAGGGGGATGGAGGSGGEAGNPGTPASTCDAPDLADTSSPDQVVGDGTPGSCTEAALATAAAAGGTITFDCGTAPVTITVSSTIVFTEESVVDGGGLVTLSGGGSARILYLDSGYDQTTPRLTVQRLAFREGESPAEGEDTAQGGGAIYRDGGSLTVIDCEFEDNHGPATGQDVAGGAIYAFGGGETIISGSTFTGNSASDGGAIGSLNGHLTIINSTIVGNAATGTEGNPGNGGCGGGVYMDGGDEITTLCGVTIADNTAGAIAAGFFRVSNSDDGTFMMERSTVSGNRVTPEDDGNAGGMYLQGLDLTITASTISANEAYYNGGIWISGREANLTNVTIAENVAFGSNGGGMWLSDEPAGTMLNCTIANNHSTADGMVAGAIFGGGLELKNTIIAGNTAMYTPGCDAMHPSGGGNLQFPGGALCSPGPTVEDPELGALANNGGVTQTMLPAAGSVAIGLGTDCPPTDQRGEPRGEPCTAGAVEAP